MARSAIVATVVFGLFLCPLRCHGVLSSPDVLSATSKTPSCCSHCANSPSSENQPAEPAVPEDCGCDQCLCQGCVVEMARKPSIELNPLAQLASLSSVLWVMLPLDRNVQIRSSCSLVDSPLFSGRLLRISRQSLLF